MNNLPELNTDRLILRPPAPKDAPAFKKLAEAVEIAENTFVPHPYTSEMAKEYIRFTKENWQTGEGANFVIVRQNDNQVLGSISYKDIDHKHHRAEFGYWIGKPFWNNGYATEAIKAIIQYGFEKLDLHRIYATPFGENKASQRVLEKAGMMKEGVMKDHIYHRGEYKDFWVYGLTEEQFYER